jgi:hypothetical protein
MLRISFRKELFTIHITPIFYLPHSFSLTCTHAQHHIDVSPGLHEHPYLSTAFRFRRDFHIHREDIMSHDMEHRLEHEIVGFRRRT